MGEQACEAARYRELSRFKTKANWQMLIQPRSSRKSLQREAFPS